MSKRCAKCEKTVYPVEELKCLEKIWHKTCFKCQVCNMTLSMKNYKGFDKLPYCGAHVPKAKATVVADTPENKRLAENSKTQSNVKYHAEFEALTFESHSWQETEQYPGGRYIYPLWPIIYGTETVSVRHKWHIRQMGLRQNENITSIL